MLRTAIPIALASLLALASLPPGPDRIAPGCGSDTACERSAPAFLTVRGRIDPALAR